MTDAVELPDLIVGICPQGCESCPGIWRNESINHTIVCKCNCMHRKGVLGVPQPVTNTAHHFIPVKRKMNKDDN